MRSVRLLLLVCAVMGCRVLLWAQSEGCYQPKRAEGIRLYQQGKPDEAIKFFMAAKYCNDTVARNDLDVWIEKCRNYLRLNKSTLEFSATNGGTQEVEVVTNSKPFRVSNPNSWCKTTQQGSKLRVICEDNTSVSEREAKISVSVGRNTVFLRVIQEPAELEMSVEPEALVFSCREETKSVSVITNAGEWQVESFPNWTTAQRKDDELLVTSASNPSTKSREDEVVIAVASRQFSVSVSQLAGDTLIEVGQPDVIVPQKSTSVRIYVNSNMKGWRAETSEAWIAARPEHDSLTIYVETNPDLFSRNGTVRISVGKHYCDVKVHQRPFVSSPVLPPSELRSIDETGKDSILVTSIPSDLRVFVDDSIERHTPFSCKVDYEHHSLLMGFERRDYFFNEKQQDIEFAPGIRFATLTFASKTLGMMSGFVSANSFGAYTHFQVATPFIIDFDQSNRNLAGYNLTFGPVYQPIQYLGIYAGLGVGSYVGEPHVGIDYEMGVMGFYKNFILSMGFHRTRLSSDDKNLKFIVGVGGYLKRYYDPKLGYCASDSRRWWSLNYVFRPAENGKGLMASDLGNEKARAYVKGLYIQTMEMDTIRSLDMSAGVVFTPVNGLIDLCLGIGAEVNFVGMENRFQGLGAEVGAIINVWRFPLTIMLHESDLFGEPHTYFDFGIGFHFGDFKRSSYY